SGVSGPCAAPGRVVVLTALHSWPPRRRRAGLGLRPDARAFLDGTRRFAQQITPDPGGSALTSGIGGRPLQARRLHVSSHMGPYTHYPQRAITTASHTRSRSTRQSPEFIPITAMATMKILESAQALKVGRALVYV